MKSRVVYPYYHRRVQKKPRMSRRRLFIAGIGVAMLALAGLGVYALRLPRWHITTVEVRGVHVLSADEIRKQLVGALNGMYFGFIPRKNYFFTNTESLAADLARIYPRIASVRVNKEFPRTLIATIEERKFWGMYCVRPADEEFRTASSTETGMPASVATASVVSLAPPPQKCAYLDKTGFAFEEAPYSSGALIIKIIGTGSDIPLNQTVVVPEMLSVVEAFSRAMRDEARIAITGFEFVPQVASEIHLMTQEGFRIWVDVSDDPSRVARTLNVVLAREIGERRKELEYIDLRLGGKVFYRMKGAVPAKPSMPLATPTSTSATSTVGTTTTP